MEKTERFSFWFTKEERAIVIQLTEYEGLSRAAFVRRLIRQAANSKGLLASTIYSDKGDLKINSRSRTNKQLEGSLEIQQERGTVIDCRFEKHVHSSSNQYHTVPGWAIDMNILEELDQEGVQDIWIVDSDTDLTYKATLSDFRDYGVPVPVNRDPLLCLPLQHWSISQRVENLNTGR